ncbi:thioredoxin-like protein [Alteromonadaceae bacterium 2753L.S.0a.02]|nr:thioredoxin-like protein [Alteromonadaceae bacterium 2753L.S.0a.02]
METPSDQTEQTSPQKKPVWFTLVIYGLVALAFYFGHVELQSYLGRRALETVPLQKLPLQIAMEKARRENKLVLADISAIWCPSCRKLDSKVLAQAEVVKAIETHYVFSRIEYESAEGRAAQKKYQVQGFPTVLVLDAQGNKLRQLPLTFNPDSFIRAIAPAH